MDRNNQVLIALINKADDMASEVSAFFASMVGRTSNSHNEEFAILVQWSDAIDDAVGAALAIRNWVSVDRLDNMRDECNMWLDHWHESVAP